MKSATWAPIELELVSGGYYARVTRDRYMRPARWRWAVTPVEIVQRWRSQPVEHAQARGYCRSQARACRMASVAIEALKKALASAPKGLGS